MAEEWTALDDGLDIGINQGVPGVALGDELRVPTEEVKDLDGQIKQMHDFLMSEKGLDNDFVLTITLPAKSTLEQAYHFLRQVRAFFSAS